MKIEDAKLGFVGSRGFSDIKLARKVIFMILKRFKKFTPVSGGAKGADTICVDICEKMGMKPIIFLPEWDKYGKSAGFRRNSQIVDESDALIAFWDGKSRGTLDSINKAKEKGIPVFIAEY